MNPSAEMSDKKLIQFYLNGNPNAMATLVELYKDRVYGSIYATLQDKFAAEEIFHDVFIRLINNMISGQLPEDGNFLQWAIRIGHTMCLEYKRKNPRAVLVSNVSSKEETRVIENGPLYHESHLKIKDMIDMLPHDQREVMMLTHYAGLSLRDITDIMKCSLSTALDNLKFGLNALRKMMTEQEIALR